MLAEDESEAPRRKRRRRRRGRRSDPDRRGFASLLPQLLTTANLASGFFAIVQASGGHVLVASYAIFVAAVFDILDGRAARMTGNVSRFGAEYDSIADTVSFGVAPSILAFHAAGLASLGWAGWVMAFTYTACASLRLARFNVSSGRYHGRFDGMPTPAGAGLIVSAVWFSHFLVGLDAGFSLPEVVPAIGVMSLGLLMVSPIPYHSFKNVRFGQSYSATVIPVLVLLLLILKPGLNFFLVGLAYVVSGPAGWLWRWRTGRSLELAETQGAGADLETPAADSGAASGSTSGATNVTSLAERMGVLDAIEDEDEGEGDSR